MTEGGRAVTGLKVDVTLTSGRGRVTARRGYAKWPGIIDRRYVTLGPPVS